MSESDNLPQWNQRPGAHEAWILTFTDPVSAHGFRIRTTLLAPSRGPLSAGIWFARLDPSDPSGTIGFHTRSSEWRSAPDAFDVVVGHPGAGFARMGSGVAEGEMGEGGHEASWDLRFTVDDHPTYRLLPGALYRGIAPGGQLSPNVDARVSGTVSVDGRSYLIEAAPAQQAHEWGPRHPERWAWAHCSDFVGEEAVFHALTALGRRGPIATPYLTSVGLRWQGSWIRLTKASRRRDFGLGSWHVDMASRRYRLTGRVEAPAFALLRARYQDPDGSERFCHSSEIASCRLALFERRAGAFEEVAVVESRGTTHAEWAGRTPAHAVEREFVETDPSPSSAAPDPVAAERPPTGTGP